MSLSQVIAELEIARAAAVCKVEGPIPVQQVRNNRAATHIWNLRSERKSVILARCSSTLPLDLKLSVRPKHGLLVLSQDSLARNGLFISPFLIDHSMGGKNISVTVFNKTSKDLTIQRGQRIAKVICIGLLNGRFIRSQL